ncbi:hypothetical protein NQD34_017147 [Periophthalmus magnuspinnatus]|nr:hypothetical protein NQD34_017147 [Periophthalmus magnuspinnatus]
MPLHKGLCNRALIMSVGHFEYGVNLNRRPGVRKDQKKLHRALSKLGFKVDIHTDLNSEEIYQLFMKESKRPVKDCFIAVLSSHGEDGCVFGADGKPVRLSQIFTYFDNECMENTAKLFFIQACRGGGLDDGVEVDSVDGAEENFSLDLLVPIDTAVMYATAPGKAFHNISLLLCAFVSIPNTLLPLGYAAFTHPCGSVFLQTFCKLLEEDGNRNMELTRLMTRLCHRVAYTFQAKGRDFSGKRQMPCLLSRMTREVYPFAEAGKDTGVLGLSASAMISTENVSDSMPSIS